MSNSDMYVYIYIYILIVSGLGNNGNEGVLHIPQNSRIVVLFWRPG